MNTIQVPELDGPVCFICDHVLLDVDKKMEFPCGCHTVHTRCGIAEAIHFVDRHGCIVCDTCDTILYESPYFHRKNNDEEINDTLILQSKNAEFKAELKKVKLKKRAINLANTAFKKKLDEEYTKFKNITQTHVMTIGLSKREAIKALKASTEYKSQVSALRVFNMTLNRFKAKYNLGYQETRLLKLSSVSRWRWRQSQPVNLVHRKFRIRI
jgi:hypothetical protein